jgi:hypothetical protein
MSSSASHALSEVEVFCAEKDSGFFPFVCAQGLRLVEAELSRSAQNDTKKEGASVYRFGTNIRLCKALLTERG